MRMKQVCEQTGLTERAVRLYVQEGLVTPQVHSGTHNLSYHFTEQDLTRLQDIAVLRQAGFGLAEIRQMLQNPEQIPALLAQRRTDLAEEILQKQKIHDALDRLTLPQQGELTRAAEALRQTNASQKGPGRRFKAVSQLLLTVLFLVLSVPLLLLTMGNQPLARYLLQQNRPLLFAAVPMVLLPVLAALSGFMAVRYATCARHARSLPCTGWGTVLLVAPDTDIREVLQNAGSGWGGLAQAQARFFLATVWVAGWNALRPDRWFPLIQYTDETGTPRAGTFVYGGLRRTWQQGQQVAIGWAPANHACPAPLQAPWLTKKALTYLGLTVFLAFCTAALWQAVLGAYLL